MTSEDYLNKLEILKQAYQNAKDENEKRQLLVEMIAQENGFKKPFREPLTTSLERENLKANILVNQKQTLSPLYIKEGEKIPLYSFLEVTPENICNHPEFDFSMKSSDGNEIDMEKLFSMMKKEDVKKLCNYMNYSILSNSIGDDPLCAFASSMSDKDHMFGHPEYQINKKDGNIELYFSSSKISNPDAIFNGIIERSDKIIQEKKSSYDSSDQGFNLELMTSSNSAPDFLGQRIPSTDCKIAP